MCGQVARLGGGVRGWTWGFLGLPLQGHSFTLSVSPLPAHFFSFFLSFILNNCTKEGRGNVLGQRVRQTHVVWGVLWWGEEGGQGG
jgi:hypothetical protein